MVFPRFSCVGGLGFSGFSGRVTGGWAQVSASRGASRGWVSCVRLGFGGAVRWGARLVVWCVRHVGVLRYDEIAGRIGFLLPVVRVVGGLGHTGVRVGAGGVLVWGPLYVVRKRKGVWLYPSGQGTSGTLVGVARLRPRDCALVSTC